MRRIRRPRQCFVVGALAVIAAAVSACGGGSGGEPKHSPPDYAKALAGAPEPLAALYDQPNRLLPGGAEAFRQRLADLEGHPVVVNKWASWCGPCREEMPWFQTLSARLGKRIAFLGVNTDDSSEAARGFLEEFPLPFPSYSDPGSEIADELNATVGFPATAIYDSRGEQVHVQQGQYASQDALASDIERYAR
jgi:cytochrome c biogenesis protein CcmG, thiol:disulfide interchange protein DsbE